MRTRRSQFSSDPVSSTHRSVLLHEVIGALDIKPTDTVVDATLGGAGHARDISHHLDTRGTFIGFDLDKDALTRAAEALAGAPHKLFLIEANFRAMQLELSKLGIRTIDKALFDLGWSGYQLDGRGFSFQRNDPLVMTYANPPIGGQALTARTIVNSWGEQSIADILFGWGEERYARRIARAIVERRERTPIETSQELAEVIRAAVPPQYRRGKLHPATKSFQALRIAVNDELGSLVDGLAGAWSLLRPGGRLAVISFHSVEDRVVKRTFAQWEKAGEGRRLTKKPQTPSQEELRENPRSRSAKLRVIEKL